MSRSNFFQGLAALLALLLLGSPLAGAAAESSRSSSSSSNEEDEDDDGSDAAVIAAAAVGVGAVAAIAASAGAASVAATIPRLDVPFGGLIIAAFPCTATTYMGAPGWYMLVLDYRTWIPMPIVILPFSRVNLHFAPLIGNAILGTFVPIPGTCTITGTDYEPVFGFVPAHPLAGIGTSLLPPIQNFVPAALPV
jgi:hypothetical protein